jgi:large subunit ribosomal protein L13
MKKVIVRKTQKIDAEGQSVGRIAAQAATFLRGKHRASFTPNIDAGDFVHITNASRVKFTGNKLIQKDYYHHTTHPGGLRRTPMKKVFEKNPADVLKRAVYGMLPKNKQRDSMFKRLTIKL